MHRLKGAMPLYDSDTNDLKGLQDLSVCLHLFKQKLIYFASSWHYNRGGKADIRHRFF